MLLRKLKLIVISLISTQKVRFAEEQETKPEEEKEPEPPKPETKEVSVWTHEPEYDNFLYVRVHTPKSIDQKDLKCMITFQNTIIKTGRLDVEEEVIIFLFILNNQCWSYYMLPL